MARWPDRYPNEELDYKVDWTERLDADDYVVATEFAVVRGTLQIAAVQYTRTSSTVWLTGGQPGELGNIRCTAHTNAGRTMETFTRLRTV